MQGPYTLGDLIIVSFIIVVTYLLQRYSNLSNTEVMIFIGSSLFLFFGYIFSTSMRRNPKRTKITEDIHKRVYKTDMEIKKYYSVRSLIHKLDTDIPYEFSKENKSFRSFKIEGSINEVPFKYHEEFLIPNSEMTSKILFNGFMIEFELEVHNDHQIIQTGKNYIVYQDNLLKFYVHGKRFLGETYEKKDVDVNVRAMMKEIERLLKEKHKIEQKLLEERK